MGVMKTKVVMSSPSSSTVLSIEASNRLITEIQGCDQFLLGRTLICQFAAYSGSCA